MIMTEPARRKPQREEEQVDTPPASPPQIDEMELVKRARHGDLESYDELVKRYQERIYATVYHMTSNH